MCQKSFLLFPDGYYKFQFICNNPSFATLRPFWNGWKMEGFWYIQNVPKGFQKLFTLLCFSSLLLVIHCVFVLKEVLLHSKKPFCPFGCAKNLSALSKWMDFSHLFQMN
jgi:hypothetical protein